MQSPEKLTFALVAAFLLPILAVLGMNYETIQRQTTPSPANGRMIYVTADR
ncbi:MAG: hypothetical protein ACK493_14425 [Planctomycetota bacterium]|jgi:hypothetical protein